MFAAATVIHARLEITAPGVKRLARDNDSASTFAVELRQSALSPTRRKPGRRCRSRRSQGHGAPLIKIGAAFALGGAVLACPAYTVSRSHPTRANPCSSRSRRRERRVLARLAAGR